jgi:hypothetical protein
LYILRFIGYDVVLQGQLKVADPAGASRRDPRVHGSPAAGRCTTMIIPIVFALLAVLSLVILLATTEDQRGVDDPRDNPLLWAFSGRR